MKKNKFLLIIFAILLITFSGCTKDISEQYGWIVPDIKSESADKYYSQLHVYYERAENKILFKEKNKHVEYICDKEGIKLNITSLNDEITSYIIAKGNSEKYISEEEFNDGYWFYFYIKDDNDVIKQFVRIGLKGEQEIIIDDIDKSGIDNYLGHLNPLRTKIIDHNIFISFYNIDDKQYIKRIYLPDMKVETIESSLGTKLIEQINSEHIYFEGRNPEFYEKYQQLKKDKDTADRLFDKYIGTSTVYENAKEEYLNGNEYSIAYYVIYQEYNLYPYAIYDYDFRNDSLNIQPIEETVFYPQFPQGSYR